MMCPSSAEIAEWQTKLIVAMMDKLYKFLAQGVFVDTDADTAVEALERDIIKEATSFTCCDSPDNWKIQAGGAVMVAAKMVMAHDYMADGPGLVRFVAWYVGGTSERTKKKLLDEELEILKSTVFNFNKERDDKWCYDINYDSEDETPPRAKRQKMGKV